MLCLPSYTKVITFAVEAARPLSGAGLYNFTLYAGRVEKTKPYFWRLVIRLAGYDSSGSYKEFR